MVTAIVMAGGKGTRLNLSHEKPLVKIKGKYLIDYVLCNIQNSQKIDNVYIATSPNTPDTTSYLVDCGYNVIETPGDGYLDDLSFLLSFFEDQDPDEILITINSDLPLVNGELIDFILDNYQKKYLKSQKPAMCVAVPIEVFQKYDLEPSMVLDGIVPSGVNILRSINKIQDEEVLEVPKIELALNINTRNDIKIFERFFGDMMEERKLIKGEEKFWSEIKGYQVATSSARILGELEELIINDKTGKITDVVIKVEKGRNVNVKGAKKKGEFLLVPFGKVEKVGEFIIIAE